MRNLAYRLASIMLVSLIIAAPAVSFNKVDAAQLNNRTLSLYSSSVSVTTQHEVSFDFNTATSIGSFQVEYCSNSPLVDEACVVPTGMDLSGAVLASESGETGFSIHPSSTASRLVMSRVAVLVTPQPSAYLFADIVNPDSTGTLYARLATYATDDGTGAYTDEGGVAASINEPVSVGAFVPPVLYFCVGITITANDCTTATGDNIDFGNLSKDFTSTGTTQMLAATNAYTGYTVSVVGTTMTSGNNTIPALSSPSSSQTDTPQFGLNMRANTNPAVGVDPSGIGFGVPSADYNSPDNFKFSSGDVIASSSRTTDFNRYTVSYIVNIDDTQAPGVYSTTLTYIALVSF